MIRRFLRNRSHMASLDRVFPSPKSAGRMQSCSHIRVGAIFITLLGSAVGCKSIGKHENPVLQPPPRRVTLDDTEVEQRIADAAGGDTAIQQVSASSADADDSAVFNARVIARVNGAPVFAGEVLERYGPYLKEAKTKLKPEEVTQLREAIIRRDLRSHIERRLLVERMKSKLKPDQITAINGHIDRLFEEHVEKIKKELNVGTRTELELALNERETSLAALRDSFGTERMAQEFLFSSLERPPQPTRPEMVEYYQAHLNDYKIPARVKWEQVQVTVGPLTKTKAEERIREARQQLQAGASFEEIAKKYSDGPTAALGGDWDWIGKGSLADQGLEKLLFESPKGQLSEVYFGKNAFHVVRVVDREDERKTPFADVQDQIQQKLQEQGEKDLPKKFVDKLYGEALIETEYDYLQPKS